MYKPNSQNQQNPPGMLPQGEQKERNCCYDFFCWFFQICVWMLIIIVIVLIINFNEDNNNIAVGVLVLFYIVYLILEFCSPMSSYLCHKTTDIGIHQKMGEYFRTPPLITFYCECYHYVIRHHTRRTKNGTRHYTTKEKVITYTETYNLPYYSERDVSGLFLLNGEKAYIERKHYIKLELNEEINFADAISYMDYQYQKEYFWRKNRFRDTHFYFNENRTIPGMIRHNLIKISEQEPCTVNYFFYFIFTIIPFVEFYKIYVNSFCIFQRFKVRKLVSTRYDLNQPVYANFVPQINLVVQQYDYQPEYYNYVNNEYKVDLPTQEELEKAKEYQNFVPDYQISSGGGNIKAGVIIDNPAYCSYNKNDAPPAFAQISGDVGLNQNQINKDGQVPTGFGEPGFKFDIMQANQNEQGYSEKDGNMYDNNTNQPTN